MPYLTGVRGLLGDAQQAISTLVSKSVLCKPASLTLLAALCKPVSCRLNFDMHPNLLPRVSPEMFPLIMIVAKPVRGQFWPIHGCN